MVLESQVLEIGILGYISEEKQASDAVMVRVDKVHGNLEVD